MFLRRAVFFSEVNWGKFMSRVGKKDISVPKDVSVHVDHNRVVISGRFGSLHCLIPAPLEIELDSVNGVLSVGRLGDDATARSVHGLVRSLIANSVLGVNTPWEKRLEIIGVGYQASFAGNVLTLNVGFSNPLLVNIPVDVKCELPDTTHIVLSSANKQLVGQIAANIRSLRPPEPYKGKGIRYLNEHVRRKSGKAFGS